MENDMLTYSFEKGGGISLYEQLYRNIRSDILSGALAAGEKLPSKRALSEHLKISVITVKNAYDQLIAEGYIYGIEKRGYYVMEIEKPMSAPAASAPAAEKASKQWLMDFVTNTTAVEFFPFATWTKVMRRTILEQDTGLLKSTPSTGAIELRQAIADYLREFRGLTVSTGQIIVGAGTEVLYNMLVQLLGRDKCYAVEDPGYRKIANIYESNGVVLRHIGLDESGLNIKTLRKSDADVVHISPNHHYPTGIVMPIGRRLELLHWAQEKEGRYILEDDYDSEFRFVGRQIPTLFSGDEGQRVIYLNTFSKTIAPSVRISYMILPVHLMKKYEEKLGFSDCTVSGFDQYTLAEFLHCGHYEQHLNRMRKRYRQKRDAVISAIKNSPLHNNADILEDQAGLHFLMRLATNIPDDDLKKKAAEKGLRLAFLSDYYYCPQEAPPHVMMVNYSGLNMNDIPLALEKLSAILEEEKHE